MDRPLDGITVVDLTHHVAGPFATRLLAAYGARVIKVERPGTGDPARLAGPFPGDVPHPERSGRFLYLNTGKESVTLDLKTPAGRAAVLEMAAAADLVVENFAPRVLPSLGLDWPTFHAVNPALSMVSISNYGQSGPYREYAGTNLTLFAAGGQMALTGEPDREPLVNGGTQALLQAGLHGFAAGVTAVFGARAHGHGVHVDISIQEVQAASLEGAGPAALVHGLDTGRTGNIMRALWGIYPCADGYVGCSCLERNVPNLLAAMGRADLLADPDFRNPRWRMEHNDEVVALLMEFFTRHTRRELQELALRHRVPFGVVATVDELLEWPTLRAKGFWQEVDHPVAGRLVYPGPPATIDGGGFLLTPAPRLGGAGTGEPGAVGESGAPGPRLGRVPAAPAAGPPAADGEPPLPLAGVRIVDLTMVWAGPYATRLLADMGADVIKVEGVANFDLVRGLAGFPPDGPERPWDRSAYFNEYNRNKRGITLDLARPEGRRALLDLVRVADALIENYRADVLEGLGLGPDVLHAERPDLVIVSMPGFAKDGPERDQVGYGPTIEQMGGLVALTGYADGPPQKTGISYGDPVAGIMAAGALVTALVRRQRTGKGAVVEVSQRDNMIGLIGEAVLDWAMNRRLQPRRGNRHPRMAPHGVYPCRPLPEAEGRPQGLLSATTRATDRWVAVAVATDAQWRALCKAIGRPELADDPRYAGAAARLAHQDELDALLREWTAERTDDEAMALLQARGIPASAVRTPLTLTTDPHLAARGFYREVDHPVVGRHRVAGPLWNLSSPRVEIRAPAPCFGQHTDTVLMDLVGLSAEAVRRLRDLGVTGDVPVTAGGPQAASARR
jgi:crotonobetainyl-CoA:carnitine CoA-transferase CaiB-like acyl-CoA transferase